MVNHYRILGIGPTADPQQIRAAYHRLALRYHPDQRMPLAEGNADADAKFLLITDAYKVLSNATRRAEYDAALNRYLEERVCFICGSCGTFNRIRQVPDDKEAICGSCHEVLPLTAEQRAQINRVPRSPTSSRVVDRLKGEARSIAGEMAMAGLRAVVRRLARNMT